MEEEDFQSRNDWESEVNSWTHLSEDVYNRELINTFVNFVPDWVFESSYYARKWEDPTNENLMLCEMCYCTHFDEDPTIWVEEGIVEPFNFKDIYENEQLWCSMCDRALFFYNTTD